MECRSDVHRVTVGGEVDYVTADRLLIALDAIPADGTVVVDLREVTLIDSSGLRVLLAARLRSDGGGGSLHVADEHPHVRRVFEITGVDGLLRRVS